jgi:hypothetical protein
MIRVLARLSVVMACVILCVAVIIVGDSSLPQTSNSSYHGSCGQLCPVVPSYLFIDSCSLNVIFDLLMHQSERIDRMFHILYCCQERVWVAEQNKIKISFGGIPALKWYFIYCTDMSYQLGTRNVRQQEGDWHTACVDCTFYIIVYTQQDAKHASEA